MNRISYERVAIEADQLIIKMILSQEYSMAYQYWKQYNAFLEACGWNDESFDKETLRRVDLNWDNDNCKFNLN